MSLRSVIGTSALCAISYYILNNSINRFSLLQKLAFSTTVMQCIARPYVSLSTPSQTLYTFAPLLIGSGTALLSKKSLSVALTIGVASEILLFVAAKLHKPQETLKGKKPPPDMNEAAQSGTTETKPKRKRISLKKAGKFEANLAHEYYGYQNCSNPIYPRTQKLRMSLAYLQHEPNSLDSNDPLLQLDEKSKLIDRIYIAQILTALNEPDRILELINTIPEANHQELYIELEPLILDYQAKFDDTHTLISSINWSQGYKDKLYMALALNGRFDTLEDRCDPIRQIQSPDILGECLMQIIDATGRYDFLGEFLGYTDSLPSVYQAACEWLQKPEKERESFAQQTLEAEENAETRARRYLAFARVASSPQKDDYIKKALESPFADTELRFELSKLAFDNGINCPGLSTEDAFEVYKIEKTGKPSKNKVWNLAAGKNLVRARGTPLKNTYKHDIRPNFLPKPGSDDYFSTLRFMLAREVLYGFN